MRLAKILEIEDEQEKEKSIEKFMKTTSIISFVVSLIAWLFGVIINSPASKLYGDVIPFGKYFITFYFIFSVGLLILCFVFNKNLNDKAVYAIDVYSFFMKIFCLIYLLAVYFLGVVVVDGNSMNPTLSNNDYLIVRNFCYKPRRNDIVIVYVSEDEYPILTTYNKETEAIVKRIIAMPGDYVSSNGGVLTVNGNKIDDNLHYNGKSYILKSDQYFIVGDNYFYSLDSRYIGPIKKDDIVGKVLYRVFPFKKIGGVN